MINIGKRAFISITFAAIIFGVVFRLYLLQNHFPHYDDLWAGYRTLHILAMPGQELATNLGINVYDLRRANFFVPVLKYLAAVFQSSRGTTLAPLHYLFSLAPVGASKSYSEFLVNSRIFTLFEYIALLLVLAIKFGRGTKGHSKVFSLLILFSLSTSSLFVYYSAQGHNYIASALVISLLIVFLDSKRKEVDNSFMRLFFVAYSLCILTSYIFIAYIPSALFLLLCAAAPTDPGKIKKSYKHPDLQKLLTLLFGILPITTTLLIYRFMLPSNASSLGVGWQAGINKQYIIDHSDKLHETLQRVSIAYSETITALFLWPNPPKILGVAISLAILVLLAASYLRSFNLRLRDVPLSTIYCQLVLLNHAGLYFLGKLALSPTRHSIILFPVISWLLLDGYSAVSLSIDSLRFGVKSDRKASIIHLITSHSRLASIILLVCYSAGLIISTHSLILDSTNNRLDPIKSQMESIGQAGAIYYSGYYNFSVAVIAFFKGFSEELVADKNSALPAILLSNGKDMSGQTFLYVTNRYTAVLPEQVLDAAKQIGCNTSSMSTIEKQSKPTIVDPVVNKIEYEYGSNSLQVYSAKCS